MRAQLLGLCRFSYLGGRGFQVEHGSIEDRRAFLYDPARLARRWAWFESVTLPGLVGQSDPDYRVVVMTGPDLPQPYLGRLHEIAAAHPQIAVELVPPMPHHRAACARALRPHVEAAADWVGQFKQDDDDAVALDFVARARRDLRLLIPMLKRDGRGYCDYMKGVILRASETGVEPLPRHVYATGVALVIWQRPDAPQSCIDYEHWRIGSHMNGIAVNDRPMFLRGVHHDNDSGALGPNYPWTDPPGDLAPLLARRFGVDLPALDLMVRAAALPGADRPKWGR
ncbi:glycosyltransferase [Paracoccus sp. SJTW-4]|uniref:glycosyltransferase n=1 Tax=Paracoccus sp. SJTW-4 TaxID=3078428 RepID=UPI0039E892B6